MRISDGSSDVCSSDLQFGAAPGDLAVGGRFRYFRMASVHERQQLFRRIDPFALARQQVHLRHQRESISDIPIYLPAFRPPDRPAPAILRSEEHTTELQSLMRISYAVFCFKKTTIPKQQY